jgi:hypothetical protein
VLSAFQSLLEAGETNCPATCQQCWTISIYSCEGDGAYFLIIEIRVSNRDDRDIGTVNSIGMSNLSCVFLAVQKANPNPLTFTKDTPVADVVCRCEDFAPAD